MEGQDEHVWAMGVLSGLCLIGVGTPMWALVGAGVTLSCVWTFPCY